MKKGIQPDRIDPAFLMELAEPMEDVYEAIQHDLIVNLARRLRKYGKLRRGDQWRALMLAETGAVHDEAMKTIAESAGGIASLEESVVREAVVAAIDAVEPALAGQLRQPDYVPAVSQTVQRVTDTYSRQALNRLNLVNTVMLNSTLSAYRKAVDDTAAIERQLAEAQKTLNRETGAVIVGTKTHQQAIRDAVTAMARNGLIGFIDKAGRSWTPQAYVSMDVHTTTANAARQAAMDRNEAHDNHLISVSSHPGARPKCAPWQGRIYSTDGTSGTARDLNGKEYEYIPLASTSYGEPDGLFGINCGHFPSPFIDGLSVMRYEPTKDKAENDRLYKESQQQRYMERKIRAVKTEADALEAAGDAEGAKEARKQARQLNAELKAWCAEKKRDYYPERTRLVDITRITAEISERERARMEVLYSNKVQLQALDAPGFVEKFNGITGNQTVDSAIYQYAVQALRNKNETNLEELYLIDGNDGTLIHSITTTQEDRSIHYTEADNAIIQAARDAGRKIISLHNHPNGLPPTLDDGSSAFIRGYSLGIVVGHNFETYTYSPTVLEISPEDCAQFHKALIKKIISNLRDGLAFDDSLWYNELNSYGMEVVRR